MSQSAKSSIFKSKPIRFTENGFQVNLLQFKSNLVRANVTTKTDLIRTAKSLILSDEIQDEILVCPRSIPFRPNGSQYNVQVGQLFIVTAKSCR